MRVFSTNDHHHLDEEDSSEREFSSKVGAEPSQRIPTDRAALDPPGSISIQLSRSISELSFASVRSSPACFDESGTTELRSILRKSTSCRGTQDLGLSKSSHEPSTARSGARPRLLGHRSKSEWNVSGACKSKTKRKKDPKKSTQGHGPGSFLADLIASRRSAFVSMDDDTEETETGPVGPPRVIHTTTAASRTERRPKAVQAPTNRPRRPEGTAVASTAPNGDASTTAPSSTRPTFDCPFDEDFTILHRRASERSLKCRDAYDDSAVAVQFRTRNPDAEHVTARSALCHGAGRLGPVQCAPSDRSDDDAARAGASSPLSEVLHTSIAQISIENPSVVDFVPHGSFGALPHRGSSFDQPPHENGSTTKPSLCGTIVTTTTIASSEEASSLEDSGSERSQPVHVMVNLSYLELTKASFSSEVCYLVD